MLILILASPSLKVVAVVVGALCHQYSVELELRTLAKKTSYRENDLS